MNKLKRSLLYIFVIFMSFQCTFKSQTGNTEHKIATDVSIEEKIPQGKFEYLMSFAEFGDRFPKSKVIVDIKNNQITVTQGEGTNLGKEPVIFQGLVVKHKSVKWILANSLEEADADEIGGCTSYPIIDFEKKEIEWC